MLHLVVPRGVGFGPIVRPIPRHDTHVVIKETVVADAREAKICHGLSEVRLPIGTIRELRVAAAERALPDVLERCPWRCRVNHDADAD